MGYFQTIYVGNTVTFTEDIMLQETVDHYTTSGSLVLMDSFRVVKDIDRSANIRLHVEGYNSMAGQGTLQWRLNGSNIGTTHSPITAGYVSYTDDVAFTNLKVNDTIEIWASAYGGGSTYVRNPSLRGTRGEFKIV